MINQIIMPKKSWFIVAEYVYNIHKYITICRFRLDILLYIFKENASIGENE